MVRRSLTDLLTAAEQAGAPFRRAGDDLEVHFPSGDVAVIWLGGLRRSDEAVIFIALEEALGYAFPVHQATLADALGYYLLQRIEYAMLPDEHLPPGLLHVLLRVWPFELSEARTRGTLLTLYGRLKDVQVSFRVKTDGNVPDLADAKSVSISAQDDLNRFDFKLREQTLSVTGYVDEVIDALAADLVF